MNTSYHYNHNLIRVVGHINPDLDSIASIICYSHLKNHLHKTSSYQPFIGNGMTHQASKVLSMLDVVQPSTLKTLRLQATDLMRPAIWSISEDISMLEALNRMKEANVRSLPVVNKDDELVGVFTESDITDSLIQTFAGSLSSIPVRYDLIRKSLKATEIFFPEHHCGLSNKIVTCALDKSKIAGRFNKGDIAIIGDREGLVDLLLERRVGLIILTNSSGLSTKVMEKIKASNCAVLTTPFDTFQTGKLISIAVPVKEFMIKNPFSLRPESFADLARKYALDAKYAIPVIDQQKKVVGVISKADLARPNYKKVILMDHNESSQAIKGIEEAEILEIVDHHRFSGISTDKPIHINTKPFGSTSTLVAESFFYHNVTIPPQYARLLLAAVCSDTLLFQSPTTTAKDQEIAYKLASIGAVDLEPFGRKVLEAADVSAAMTPAEMLENDRKLFNFNGRKIEISQLETTSYKWLGKIKEKLLTAMDKKATASGIDGILLMVTNVLRKETRLLIKCNDRFYIEEVFGKTIQQDEIYLPGVVSRKKEIVPAFGVKTLH